MITKFDTYIVESRKSVDELETLNPDQLGELLIAEVKKYSPDLQYIQDIIACGCPIDIRDEDDITAMHLASMFGHLNILKFLISKGAQLDARHIDGLTPLHVAVYNKRISVVKLLVSNGADINARDMNGRTALHHGTRKYCEAIVEFLISNGAQVNARDNRGRTAWDLADDRLRNAIPKLEPTT